MFFNRSKAKVSQPRGDVIVIHDSDSEPEGHGGKLSSKRQKVTSGKAPLPTAGAKVQIDRTKNAHLKGRKRFNADFEDTKQVVKDGGFLVHGWRIKKFRPGDDEGSMEVVIEDSHVPDASISLTMLVDDTSEYPKNHTVFCYSSDSELDARTTELVNEIATSPARPIVDTLERFLTSLAGKKYQEVDMEDEDDSGDEEYVGMEYDDDYAAMSKVSTYSRSKLQRDFIDAVGTGYRPGFIPFGGDDFCLTISLPVITLSKAIPPRALMAWDRRLLSRSQHLTLLISGHRGMYPSLSSDGSYSSAARRAGVQLKFQVGLCGGYKPSTVNAKEAVRRYGLVLQDAEDELRIQKEKELAAAMSFYDGDVDMDEEVVVPVVPEVDIEEEDDEGRFDKFSLSSSLESLLDRSFLKVVRLRRQFDLGWAGAELLFSEIEKSQMTAEDVYRFRTKEIKAAEKEEQKLNRTLPHDPLRGLGKSEDINLPLTAFSYLIRRLTLCTRYCIVCHNKLTTDFEALKPYVCDSKLCAYQYYSLNHGPSLEYEIIHNPQTVDLLVSLTYSGAAEGVLDEPLPIGMGLRVPIPDKSLIVHPSTLRGAGYPGAFPGTVFETPSLSTPRREPVADNHGLCDFDDLDILQMRASIAAMLNTLPTVEEMKKHLERKVKPGKSKPKLRELDPTVLPAAWQILRWCVASCTAYLEPIISGAELITNLDPSWRQFRFSVGAPDAEAKFQAAVTQSQATNANAVKYPSLFAFHGSPLRNWHSIIRHGLWYKQVANGRAYGNGVYLAKDGQISMGHYAAGNSTMWRKSKICPNACVALAEVVNLPEKFVSSNPYFVIADTTWIVCRYLLVKCPAEATATASVVDKTIPFVKLDPKHPLTLSSSKISIPEPGYTINLLLQDRQRDLVVQEPDEEDQRIFDHVEKDPIIVDDDDDDDHEFYDADEVIIVPDPKGKGKAPAPPTSGSKKKAKPADDWKHDPKWVSVVVDKLMPPPTESANSATMAVQRELRSMLKEQEAANSLRELGWYMPPEFIGDNLFQWIVEMHSFDPSLPIAKDLKIAGVNSIIFEIRFPPTFPLAPPFFRILTPRFLPFIHGGGGHVTGGGSICMDLLTSDGWLPSYSIPAVIMQIKLAISNLDPRPARLAKDWHREYHVYEALEGYKRAAAAHGWQIPVGIEKLVR
ncbi:uncharacterized protein EV420DRAFT_1507476 [Desarmillaria tabescens]|uniref:UBC core domain-containing protein n=1 Tax=Armillaria tabescens TaxID=1929756 RepID=A0AA39NKD8_ARMTA|nr:uncharacterized protein EV420DRAFT_1507476 [Desarmillaria tabescens]KAK0467149.1 hypothetical protein EV420DRAFT_1507476 [Desarmillaria tabescens]